MRKLRILLIGSGGREAALDWAMMRSPLVETVLCAPGNGGIDPARRRKVGATDLRGIVHLALVERIDLVVVGPEAPLVAGLADMLREHGIFVFGPDKFGAQLEGSKLETKLVCGRLKLPTAPWTSVYSNNEVSRAVRGCESPLVVKANGLRAGKGVVVPKTPEEAELAARAMLDGSMFGDREQILILERNLTWGRERECWELSVIGITDGTDVILLPPVKDHKRAYDGDTGPNTGGMGGYSPMPDVTPEFLESLRQRFFLPIIRERRERGYPYRGAIFIGFMMTPDGPYLLEINCRFGDPETQVILPRLKTDIVGLMMAASGLDLRGLSGLGPIKVSDDATVGVVLAANGYPGTPETGFAIPGLEAAARHALVLHAGTELVGGEHVGAGGRLVTVVGKGPTIADAFRQAYFAADEIVRLASDNVWCRTDIGREFVTA